MSDVIRDVDHNIRYGEFDATTQADPRPELDVRCSGCVTPGKRPD